MYYTVYRTVNNVNNKIYVGKHQTKKLDDDYLGSGIDLSVAILKYGKQNFSKDILYIFDTEEEMNTKESELVNEEFCSRDDTYNLCPGGKGGWGFLNSNSEVQKAKNIKSHLKQKQLSKDNPDWAKKKSQKISAANKNSYLSGDRVSSFKKSNATAKWTKGRIWVNNTFVNRLCKPNDIPEGFVKGMLKINKN